MTTRLKEVHIEILKVLEKIDNENKKPLLKFFNIFNDQIDESIAENENKTYPFMMPACFFEFVHNDCKVLGGKVSSYPDAEIKLHICNQLLNVDAKLDKNLKIFDIKELIKNSIQRKSTNIPYCSTFLCNAEKLDFQHGNTYRYVLSFKTNFIDISGTIYDEDSGNTLATLSNPTLTIPELGMFGATGYINSRLTEDDTIYVQS